MGRKRKEEAAPSTAASKNGRRRLMDWSSKPYAVVVGGSPVIKECFPNLDEAIKFVSTMTVEDQLRACIGKFSALDVKVQTTVKIKQ